VKTDGLPSIRGRRVASLAQSRLLVVFFTLAIGISWAAWIPLFAVAQSPTSVLMIPGAFGPAIAAATVRWLRGESVRAWLVDNLDWHTGARWYLLALGLPLGVALALGASLVTLTDTFAPMRVAAAAATYPLSVLALAVLGGGQEELGWRGYALPVLQERFDALGASVLVGGVWSVWHLPAFYFGVPGYTGPFLHYALLVVGVSVILTWLYNETGGSVLLAMLLHGGINAAPGLGVVFVGGPSTLGVSPTALLVPIVWAVALALVVRYGRETLSAGPAVTSDARASDARPPGVPA
jgi:membrane protease YdiL (CAAX protease family)